tara:strand:- start:5690 stop:6226 length:537 start_codon:yes stop_codon:yes gene_type:complete
MTDDALREAATVLRGQARDHIGVAQDGLHHSCVHIDQRRLQKMQSMRGGFLVPNTVGGNFATLAEEHKAVGAVPVLDKVQSLVNFPPVGLRAQVAAQEYRLNGAAKLRQRLVGGAGSNTRAGPGRFSQPPIRGLFHRTATLDDWTAEGDPVEEIVEGLDFGGFRSDGLPCLRLQEAFS